MGGHICLASPLDLPMKTILDNEHKNELELYLELLSQAVSKKLSHRFLNLLSVLVATLEIPCGLLSLDK